MNDFELKFTIYIALTASVVLAVLLLSEPVSIATRAGAVLLLWGCGLLVGMYWQALLDKQFAAERKE